ncbi:MAG: HU family DNA-binding protein, partial [Bacteroidales bacterium]
MAIQYILVERVNPMDRTAPGKFYATSVKRGSMGLEDLAERISKSSTASEGDILLVLKELSTQLRMALVQGYSVKVPGLGHFRVTLNGIGSDSPEEFTVNLIRGPRVCFLPEGDLM